MLMQAVRVRAAPPPPPAADLPIRMQAARVTATRDPWQQCI